MRRNKKSLEQRLLEKTVVDAETGCWQWTGAKTVQGYGYMMIGGMKGRQRKAHRLAAMLWLDFDIDSELCVCHRCDNPLCVNSDHLFIGTVIDNNRDRAKKKRGRESYQQGADNPNHRLSEEEVREIMRRGQNGETQIEIARHFGIQQAQVSRIVRKQSWSHIWKE